MTDSIETFEGPRIVVRGARTHNLRDVDVDVPRDRLVVITGPSGSGKSSLAFDTIFAEGQRRYVASLSVRARQHLAQLPRPDADLIEGLSPAVAIDQDHGRRSARATVGTMTEIIDYLRLLVAKVGVVHSYRTGEPMQRHSPTDMVEGVLGLGNGTKLSIGATVVRSKLGDHAAVLADLRQRGFIRVLIDGVPRDLSDDVELDPTIAHDIVVIIDRIKLKPGIRSRVADSVEVAIGLSGGSVDVLPVRGSPLRFSERYAELDHDIEYPDVTPALLSYNSVHGACPTCEGRGERTIIDPRLIVPDPSLPMPDAVVAWQGKQGAGLRRGWTALAKRWEVEKTTPWADLPEELKIAVLEGESPLARGKPFEGVRPWLLRLSDSDLEWESDGEGDDDGGHGSRFEATQVCPDCGGKRLRREALMVRLAGRNIDELGAMPLTELATFLDGLSCEGVAGDVAQAVLQQVQQRLVFLVEMGLGYLNLERPATSLSGGELQRIRLAAQVGSGLVGVTYVLDEPSIGLHPRDNDRLIAALHRLRDAGNSVIVVEHDIDTVRAADWVIDMGPGAGEWGGQVVAAGTPAFLARVEQSPTGRYLRDGSLRTATPNRPTAEQWLQIEGATGHNLKDVTVAIPLGRFTCVTGVSGSGKSSLIVGTLLPEAARVLQRSTAPSLPHRAVRGLEHLDKVIHVDQSPIGRSGKSNPATYAGILSDLRPLFAQLPEARIRGYSPARFSFNVKGGRCETCGGEGVQRIEMHFLPDLYRTCESCQGRRYNRETLDIQLRGKNIAEILAMSVHEACEFLTSYPQLRTKLEVLRDVGLGYLRLDQSALVLSGGEAQRLKLAKELARTLTGKTLFVLDEPTTGLHVDDVARLLDVLDRLVDEGNTVVVIEHEVDVVRAADYVIDMGPCGGDGGGHVVAERETSNGRCLESPVERETSRKSC